jgi:L-alanine-DL-glutamate epimerase-like enolase superfamily enzyme
LKITSIESFVQGTNPGIVRVRTEDGAEGCGQLSPYDADITAAILHRKIAPFALGVDPADIGAVADRCMEKNYKFPWSFVCRALTGLDTVVWDWLGRHERKSVCELLGGNPVHPT